VLRPGLIAHRRVIESELFVKLKTIRDMLSIGRVDASLNTLGTVILVKIDLPRGFGECLEGAPSLGEVRDVYRLSVWLRFRGRSFDRCSGIRDTMEFKASSHTIGFVDGGTFLGDMRGQAIYPAFRKVLTALLASVRIPVAVVVELGAPDEVLKDEGIGLAAHCALRSVVSASPATVSVRVLSALIPPNTNTGSPEDLGANAGLRA
jgi:hypothetical protein